VTKVRSYRRRDGTWVRSHTRRTPGRRSRTHNRRRTSSWMVPEPRSHRESNVPRSGSSFEDAMRRKYVNDKTVEAAVEYCADIFMAGTVEATAGRVAKYATEKTWNALWRKRRPRRCRWLNEMAQAILTAKSCYHELTASVIGKILRPVMRRSREHRFATELVENIPLPGDELFVATAHGLRVTGVALCASRNIPPQKCACFEALVLEHGKDIAKRILVAQGDKWMATP
jgi:hypothetical protein